MNGRVVKHLGEGSYFGRSALAADWMCIHKTVPSTVVVDKYVLYITQKKTYNVEISHRTQSLQYSSP